MVGSAKILKPTAIGSQHRVSHQEVGSKNLMAVGPQGQRGRGKHLSD